MKSSSPPNKRNRNKERLEFMARMRALLGSDAECQELAEHLAEFSEHPPRALRMSRIRGKNIKEFIEKEGFRLLSPLPWDDHGFFTDLTTVGALSTQPALGSGLAFIQEAGAMEAVNLLDPQPGEVILDLAAAPGAKATQIGERLAGRGWLFANDPVKPRAERLDLLLARHGIYNSSVYALDPGTLAQRFPAAFDKIMLDAPCSGESLFAKRSDKRVDIRDVDVKGCARRQFKILEFAAEMLRPAGRLLYSTCTYSREENEDIVEAFLANNPNFSLVLEQRRWPHKDRVAGGYSALVEKKSESGGAKFFSQAALKNTAGLIRHGAMRWNGERDLFVEALSAFKNQAESETSAMTPLDIYKQMPAFPYQEEIANWEPLPFVATVELNDREARSYLKGDALILSANSQGLRGLVRLVWKAHTLGYGKAVGDRINNQLPKILRGYESFEDGSA